MRRLILAAMLTLPLTGRAADPVARPSMRASLDHVAISVSNVQASAAFYKGAFGFAELKTPFAGGGGVVWLDLGHGMALHLFGGRVSPVTNEHERHIAITVSDMSRVTSFLASKGMAWQNFDGVVGKMQTRPDGVRQMFFRDPDGYWVEVNDALKQANGS